MNVWLTLAEEFTSTHKGRLTMEEWAGAWVELARLRGEMKCRQE